MLSVHYLGGPTAVLEIGGLRFLTDPTFDPEGEYPIGSRALTKTIGAVVSPDAVGPVDAVLLSHDQHPDNLDLMGREFVTSAPLVLSTASAEERLGPPVRALPTWSSMQLDLPGGGTLRVTAVPALHGPEGSEPVVGEVTGFVLGGEGLPTVYVSGDNASLENVAAIAERFERVDVALLFAGAAGTALLDGAFLTLTSEAAAAAAQRLGAQYVVPLHFEGWAHFTQGRNSLLEAFADAGLTERLRLPNLGDNLALTVG